MKLVLRKNEGWRAEDWLLFLILIFQDIGSVNVLPLNLYQILMILMLVVSGVKNFRKKGIMKIPNHYLLCIGCIVIVTFTHRFDMESVKSVGYFAIQLLTLTLYLLDLKEYRRLFGVIYRAGVIIAFYGVIQEIGYLLNIPAIYDTTRYGFNTNGAYTVSFGFLRAMSIYSEPSHVAFIISLAFLVGMISLSDRKDKKSILGVAVLCIYAFFTLSLIVWMCLGTAILIYIFIINKGVSNKIKWFTVMAIAIMLLFILQQDFFAYVFGKFQQFQCLSTDTGNDLSALAVVSNLKVAWAKNLDGHLFGTGFDSHRLYYDQYIGRFYSSLAMYLNSSDGASFYVRVLSEFGVVGLAAFMAAMGFKICKARKTKDTMMLVFLILYPVFMLRNGNYVYVVPAVIFTIIFILPLKEHDRLCGTGVLRQYESNSRS